MGIDKLFLTNLHKKLYGILGQNKGWLMHAKERFNLCNVTLFKCDIGHTPNIKYYKGVILQSKRNSS